jgi:hypothetical protein
MKTNETLFGQVPYETPNVEVSDLLLEGVLCASDKEATTEEWEVVDLSNL